MKSKRFTPILTKGRGFCMILVLTLEKGSKIQEKAYFICEVPLREKRAFFYKELAAGRPKTSILTAEPEQR